MQEIEPDLAMSDDMGAQDAMGEVVPFPISFVPPHIEKLQRQLVMLSKMAMLPNAAEVLDEVKLSEIGRKVVREYKIDRESRQDWEDKAKRAMDIARQVREVKNTPWENSSNVKYPLLTTAALQFGARAYPAIVDGPRIVKTKVMGRDPDGQKAAAGERVSEHMSYQLLHETEWESDMDTMVHMLPIVGCCFKKVYADGYKEAGFCDDLVPAFDFVVHQKTKSLTTVPRATHVFPMYPHEIAERQRAGTMLDVDLKGESDDNEDDDAAHMLLEQHRYLDLDGDGVLEPWIVTVHERTEKVLKIKPAFDPGEVEIDQQRGKILRFKRKGYFVKIPFIPDPNGGFYDVGLGHLLSDVNEEIDTAVNQMNDAATMQNAGGGFMGGGIDAGKGKAEIRISPGVYKTVRASGPDLKNNIVPFAHPGPSKTTLDLLTLMIEAGKDISGIQDIMVGDQKTNQTATTTLALIEQGMKVFTAIYKRIFRALKEEFKLIFEINKATINPSNPKALEKYLSIVDALAPPPPPQMMGHNGGPPMGDPQMMGMDPAMMGGPMMPPQGPPPVDPALDYQGLFDITPVADPNNITDMQRMAKAQMALEQVVNGNPHVNAFEATKRAFEAARIEKVDELLVPPPPPDQPPPPTPEERMAEAKIAQMEREGQLRQAEREAELAHKQQVAEIDAAVKQAEAEAKMAEIERKVVEASNKLEIQAQEMNLREQALRLQEQEMGLKATESALKHEVAAGQYKVKLDEMHGEKGLPAPTALKDLLDMARQAREEIASLGQTVRKPRSIKMHRGQDGRAEMVETPDGLMRVVRDQSGAVVSLEPAEAMA